MRSNIISALFLVSSLAGCASESISKELACDPSLVTTFAEQKRIPGMGVAIGVRGQLAWSHGYGFSELSTASQVSADTTKFRIGSTSKAFTAFATARLAQDRRIDIDRDIVGILPDLPETYSGVTMRRLAGHLGGVRHYASNAELGSNVEYPTTTAALGIFIEDPLVAPPGATFSYSTYGYTVLSAALEAATNEEYLPLMSTVVFEPLQMTHTSADLRSIQTPQRTEFYYLNTDGKLVIGDAINSSYKWAGGGFLSSVEDLVRFGLAHFDSNLLTDASRKMLWTSQKNTNGESTGYGVGWFVEDRWVEHPGGALGGSTLLRIYPEEEVVVAITANLSLLGPNRFGDLPNELFQCALRLN